jgi:hypothetical protein
METKLSVDPHAQAKHYIENMIELPFSEDQPETLMSFRIGS